MINRRRILQATIAGAGLLTVGTGLFRRPALAQSATLMSMVFISKRLDASTADYRKWYIDHHAPDFMLYAKKYVSRYTQDFVEKGHMGAVDFDCISEFGYRSHELREGLFKAVEEPENQKILARHPRIGVKPGPNEAHDGPRRFSIDEQLVAGTPRGFDKPGAFKQAAMLRIKGGASRDAFNAAARKYALSVAGSVKGTSERVMIDLAVPEPGAMTPLYDAVIQVWPKGKADHAKAFTAAPAEVELVNVLDLLAYESDTGGL